jgi:uncharacterized protein YndB with AHSA1/START domain
MTTKNDETPADRQIVTTRILDAPRELVWKVWTDPAHVHHWWGPAGFSTTTQRMDVRPGGQWRFTMHGPDGRDYQNTITFRVVEPPTRLVYEHGGELDLEAVIFETTVTFEPMPGEPHRTRLTMCAVFPSQKARDFVIRECGAVAGAEQHLARLAERVAAVTTPASGGSQPFVLQRVVAAPRELVWKVWTEREHLAKWFGPKGCTLSVLACDLRPGGVMHYGMRFPGAPESFGRWVFRSIVAPERLEFVVSFADAHGNPVDSPFPGWPREMASIVTFLPHAGIGGGTVITLQWSALGASEAEQRTFDDNHPSMQQGWSGTFEQLDAHLGRLR